MDEDQNTSNDVAGDTRLAEPDHAAGFDEARRNETIPPEVVRMALFTDSRFDELVEKVDQPVAPPVTPVAAAASAPEASSEPAQPPSPVARPDLEIGRGLWHATSIMSCGLLASLLPPFAAVWALTFFTLLFVAWELLRRWRPDTWNFRGGLGKLMRQEETDGQVSAGTWYMAALFLIYFLVPTKVLQVTVFMVGVADPAARMFGKTFGRRKLPFSAKKTWMGSLGCLVISTLAGALSSWVLGFDYKVACAGALVGTAAEALPDHRWLPSDNFRMTLLSGLVMSWLLSGCLAIT